MEERPPKFPHQVPEVPKKPLYLALLLPPAVPLFSLFLELVAGAGVGFPWMNFVAIAVGMGLFYQAVSRRYRGGSRSFLLWSYMFGQIIVCIALWIGIKLLDINRF